MSKLNWLFIVMLLVGTGGTVVAQSRKASITSVTGHYRFTKEEFRNRLDVQQLSNRKIKFHLLALWVSHNNPDNIHNGEFTGTAPLKNGIAMYDQDDCVLKIEFFSNRARIIQIKDEGCGFGANVSAAGIYRKLDSKKPDFAE